MERRYPPAEYVAHLNAIGGFNRYNEANFKLVWGQNETDIVYGTDADGRRGQHLILRHGGIPSWFIDVWKPPEILTPEQWYAQTWDWEADLPTLGDYPCRGWYEPAPFNLYVKHVENNVLTFDAMPLNHFILDLVIPNLMKEQETTYAQKKAALEKRMLVERERAAAIACEAYLNSTPAFHGVAGTYESNREKWEARIKAKQAGMTISRDEIVRRMGLGHVQRRRLIR
jgi:hypothetical protein